MNGFASLFPWKKSIITEELHVQLEPLMRGQVFAVAQIEIN